MIVGDQVLLWLAVAGVAALLAANPLVFKAVQYAGAAYLAWIGLRLLFSRGGGSASPIRIEPRHYARQAFFITLLNPKAIVFYMAFFPLFIDPATHRGLPTFAAMAATIAVITAVYCLTLCAFANAVAAKVRRTPHGGALAGARGRGVPDRLRHPSRARLTMASATRRASSASPTRKAGSARPPPPSTSPPAWRRSASACWWSTSTRRATRRWARASTSASSS